MNLAEFIGADHPSDKIMVGWDTIKQMIDRKDEVDTEAFLFCYKNQMGNLAAIAAERALTREWENHPMFGIASPLCTDKWAKSYQETLMVTEAIFNVLVERAGRI